MNLEEKIYNFNKLGDAIASHLKLSITHSLAHSLTGVKTQGGNIQNNNFHKQVLIQNDFENRPRKTVQRNFYFHPEL